MFTVAALAALGLAACGGGGGSGGGGSSSGGGSGGGGGGGSPTYTVGGTVSGLAGSVVLQNNGGDDLAVSANGAFTFGAALATAGAYAVTVLSQPAGQTCTAANAAGSIAGAKVVNIAVNCVAKGPAGARISAGNGYTLAVRADGSVLAFGSGMKGGSGTALAGTAARVISGLSSIADVTATTLALAPAYALAADGTVFGWGQGVLGDSVTGVYGLLVDTPVVASALGRAIKLSACPGQSLPIIYALHADGTVWYAPETSKVANDAVRTSTAKAVPALGVVVAMSMSCPDDTVYALTVVKSDGTVWNLTPSFNLASGPAPLISTTTIDLVPGQVPGLPQIADVSCSARRNYCLARSIDGRVFAWGDNTFGQLGDGSSTGRTVPIEVPGLTSVAKVQAGAVASYAIAASGVVYSWGGGQGNTQYLGRAVNSDALVPKPVSLPAKAVGISASNTHIVVQLSDGTVWGWGSNAMGELGDGTTGNSYALPVQALGIKLN